MASGARAAATVILAMLAAPESLVADEGPRIEIAPGTVSTRGPEGSLWWTARWALGPGRPASHAAVETRFDRWGRVLEQRPGESFMDSPNAAAASAAYWDFPELLTPQEGQQWALVPLIDSSASAWIILFSSEPSGDRIWTTRSIGNGNQWTEPEELASTPDFLSASRFPLKWS